MPPRSVARLATAVALAGASIADGYAQDQDLSVAASVAGIAQFNANLDDGGRVNWAGGVARGSLTRRFTPQFSAGLAVRYDYQSWNFNQPAAFGGIAPWTNLNVPNVGMKLTYALAPDLFLAATPSVEWAFENGARTSDALTYGATASLAKAFSRDLVLGLGVGVFRRIDKTQALPYLVVDWKIDDRWRLSNPFQAGPAGGAGVELVYAPNERWEIAEGVTYRSYRFRLSETNPTPSGIAENSFIPLFLRISRHLSPDVRLDFYGALTTGGKLSVDNADGSGRYSDNYKIGPALGVTLVYRR